MIRQARSYLLGAMSGASLIAVAVVAFVLLVSAQVFEDFPIRGLIGSDDEVAVSAAETADVAGDAGAGAGVGAVGASGGSGGARARGDGARGGPAGGGQGLGGA